jgi:hypothetical protein
MVAKPAGRNSEFAFNLAKIPPRAAKHPIQTEFPVELVIPMMPAVIEPPASRDAMSEAGEFSG